MRPHYKATEDAEFIRDFMQYLFVFRPTITGISEDQIKTQDGNIEHVMSLSENGGRLVQSVTEWYVLATWNGSGEVIRSLQNKVQVRDVEIIQPSEN